MHAVTRSYQRSQYYCHFTYIGSWFNHRPNSCHRATDTKKSSVHRCQFFKFFCNQGEL